MKPGTPGKKIRARTRKYCAVLTLFLLASVSCRKEGTPLPVTETSLRIAHVQDYAWQDRKQSGQPVDMKPETEREALYREVAKGQEDILLIRGLGSRASLTHLQQELHSRGTSYPHAVYIAGKDAYSGLGFLAKNPFTAQKNLNAETYRIEDRTYTPAAGGVLIQTPSFPRLWIWNYTALEPGQRYEQRRNDFRILSRVLRDSVQAGDAVLLSFHSREPVDGPLFEYLTEAGLHRVAPQDDKGDHWTHRDPEGLHYMQDQWIYVSENLKRKLETMTVFDSEDIRQAGEYRHQGVTLP